MKAVHLISLCTCLLLLFFSMVNAYPTESPLVPRYKEGELLVRFKDSAKATKSLVAHKSDRLRYYSRLKLNHVRLADGVSVKEALESYRNDPNVLYAEPNYRLKKAAIPSDTQYSSQWNLPLISAPAAWDRFTGSQNVVVAVLDTGIAYTHPDLIANLWTNPGEIPANGIDDDSNGIVDDFYGANFGGIRGTGDPWDDDTTDSHGTHLSGIVGAVGNNNLGVSGINWAVKVMAVKFLHGSSGSGQLSDVLKAIEYAMSKQAKIINLSFEVDENPIYINDIKSLREAFTVADQAGVLIVSAAGNKSSDLDNINIYPASIRLPNNTSVAAATRTDTLANYSDYGRHTVDLAAPGGVSTGSSNAILSTVWLNNGNMQYRSIAGTSTAAPHVAGAMALIWGNFPNLTHYQVKARILNGVDVTAGYTSTITGGRLNLSKSLGIGDLPAIFNVTPYTIPFEGGTVVITGANFGSLPGSLMAGNLQLNATSWSDTSITAFVPGSATGTFLQVNGSGTSFPINAGGSTVQLSAAPSFGFAPLVTTINAVISGISDIVLYEWDMGDGVFHTQSGTTAASTVLGFAGSYQIRLRVTDKQGKQVIGSTTVTAVSQATGGGGGCFIATAAFGSYLHPKVQVLRDFRDRFLLTNKPGRFFVRLYYATSPPIADFISRHNSIRTATRYMLTPVVLFVSHPFYMLLGIFVSGAALFITVTVLSKRKSVNAPLNL